MWVRLLLIGRFGVPASAGEALVGRGARFFDFFACAENETGRFSKEISKINFRLGGAAFWETRQEPRSTWVHSKVPFMAVAVGPDIRKGELCE